MNQEFLDKVERVEAEIDELIERSEFPLSAARMSEARGLVGAEAVQYAAALVNDCRQQMRRKHFEKMADVVRSERHRILSILNHPAAQGQQGAAHALALRTRLTAEEAIAKLRDGCTETAGDDASALASAILNSDAPDGGAR